MKPVTMTMLLIVAIVLSIAAANSAAAGDRAKYGRYMTPQELYALYGDKSWKWENGAAGHFARGHRKFTSVLSVKNGSYGTGKWTLPGRGKLCFRALWRTKQGNGKAWTCFTHRTKDGMIFQKRRPNGKWYVFKHAKPKEEDEFNKLVAENLVRRRLAKITGG